MPLKRAFPENGSRSLHSLCASVTWLLKHSAVLGLFGEKTFQLYIFLCYPSSFITDKRCFGGWLPSGVSFMCLRARAAFVCMCVGVFFNRLIQIFILSQQLRSIGLCYHGNRPTASSFLTVCPSLSVRVRNNIWVSAKFESICLKSEDAAQQMKHACCAARFSGFQREFKPSACSCQTSCCLLI